MPTIHENGKLLVWATDIERGTLDQAAKATRLPIVSGPVALMPDAHVGMGATVGSVIPTEGAIIPAAVGVDIGCGMVAVQTSLTASDLPDSLDSLVSSLSTAIPSGVGKGHDEATKAWGKWYQTNHTGYSDVVRKLIRKAAKQFGSLGSGNHFAEVCLDEFDNVWLVLHSGSRGVGNQAAVAHINTAKGLAKGLAVRLEDPDLAYLVEGSDAFQEYMADLLWCQAYALGNREAMMDAFQIALGDAVGRPFVVSERINCHHNYTAIETHLGRRMFITRKGAINAHEGQLGIIPGSMGTRSYIVKGRGNPESYCSCSHGAGRRMSRSQAKREISVEQFREQMAGVGSWQSDVAEKLIDEAPSSYKDIDQVMADQSDLVEIVATLHQVVNYKGL